MKIDQELMKQYLMEVGRIVLIAVVPVSIVMLEAGEIDWKALGIVGILAVLKGLDRALHETKLMTKGITRF